MPQQEIDVLTVSFFVSDSLASAAGYLLWLKEKFERQIRQYVLFKTCATFLDVWFNNPRPRGMTAGGVVAGGKPRQQAIRFGRFSIDRAWRDTRTISFTDTEQWL